MSPQKKNARRLAGTAGVKTNPLEYTTPLLIDAKAAALMLGIAPRTLWTYTNCGAIPSRKIGRAVRYCPDELRAWVKAGCPTSAGAGDAIRKGVK